MEIKILADGCERRLPSGATQTYPIGWAGDVSEEAALRWIGEGKAEAIGGEAALSPSQLEFLKAFAEHAMAEIAAQQAGQVVAGEELPAEGEVAQVLEAGDATVEEAAGTIAGLPPEVPLEAVAETQTFAPAKTKRR